MRSYHRPWHIPWVRGLLGACVVLVVLAIFVEALSRLRSYAGSIENAGTKRPLKRLVLVHAPPWLSPAILNRLARAAVDYACYNKKHPRYAAELRNPLDGKILVRLAHYYMTHQPQGMNAWIKHVRFVRRVWLPHQQIIEIAAEYRAPIALIKLSGAYYLVSAGGVRLPGRYAPGDVASLRWLVQIVGVAAAKAPAAGRHFHSSGVRIALRIIRLIHPQPFAGQIRAVDMSNLHGRIDKTAPWIVLWTTFGTKIIWGLPPGEEGFYEVPARRKIASLAAIYQEYHRVDAGRAYVDIRDDQVLVPRPATQPSPAIGPKTPVFP